MRTLLGRIAVGSRPVVVLALVALLVIAAFVGDHPGPIGWEVE